MYAAEHIPIQLYQPVGESATNLGLMLQIDKLFTERPEMGVRRMHQELTTEAEPLNIKRIRQLMRLMDLEAVGPKPNLSKPQPSHTIYPYLRRGVPIERVNQVWSTDIRYVPMATGFLYLCRTGGDRLVQPVHSKVATEQYLVGRFLCRCLAGSPNKLG